MPKVPKRVETRHASSLQTISNRRNIIMGLVLCALAVAVLFALFYSKSAAPPGTPPVGNYAGNFGIHVLNVDGVIAREFGASGRGVLVNRVYPNTPAAVAGVRRGDILIEINGSAVSSVSLFKSLLFTLDFSRTTQLTVIRGNREMALDLAPGSMSMKRGQSSVTEQPTGGEGQNSVIALAIFVVVFCLLFFTIVDRVLVMTLGAVSMIIAGGYTGFYSQEAAFGAIKLNVLALLLGLNIITIVLERGGFFEYASKKILIYTRGDVRRITIVFCLATYFFSAFVNNLTTIMVFLPVSLAVIRHMSIDPKKFLFCEIVASNLGGASSMIGDFPNMLIASEHGVLFHDFLFNMTPVTLILLVVMLIYFGSSMEKTGESGDHNIAKLLKEAESGLSGAITDIGAVSRGMGVLAALIIGFVTSGIINIHPSTMAIAGGFFLLLFDPEPSRVFREIAIRDIIFFAALFVLVGGLESTGLLENIAYWLSLVSGQDIFIKLVLIMLLSAFVTAFLNAGPSTALFLPIISLMTFPAGSYMVWWALSLGVCIGSSATLTGATAGPVAVTIYEKFMKDEEESTISFLEYTMIGLPLMGIFTVISVIYIGILTLM